MVQLAFTDREIAMLNSALWIAVEYWADLEKVPVVASLAMEHKEAAQALRDRLEEEG
jgi:hypothetical protein